MVCSEFFRELSLVAGAGFYKTAIRSCSALPEMIASAYFKDRLDPVGMDIHASPKSVQMQLFSTENHSDDHSSFS